MSHEELQLEKLELECQKLKKECNKLQQDLDSSAGRDGWSGIVKKQIRDNLLTWVVTALVALVAFYPSVIVERVKHFLDQTNRKTDEYKAIAAELSEFIFMAELLEEWYRRNWTSKEELTPIVTDYNRAVTKVRSAIEVHSGLIGKYWNAALVQQFKGVVQEVLALDRASHLLNDETGLVARGEKKNADPKRAKAAANALATRLPRLKETVSKFVVDLAKDI